MPTTPAVSHNSFPLPHLLPPLSKKAFFAKHRRVSRALVGADLAAKDLKLSAKDRRRSLAAEGAAAAPVRDSLLPGGDDADAFQVWRQMVWAKVCFFGDQKTQT